MDQALQLITHYHSSIITPSNGTRFAQILFMKIYLINHQRRKLITIFRGQLLNSIFELKFEHI